MAAIRSATTSDAAVVAALAGELGYPATAAETETRLARLLASPGDAVVVAEDGGNVVAWMHLSAGESLDGGAIAEIRTLVVAATHRGSGVGAALVRYAVEWARTNGACRLRVRCNVVRERTHRFYKREGFTETKRQIVFDQPV